MGRCFRCKTEFSSGMLRHGHEYCVTCYLRLAGEDEAKRRREEAVRRQREEARRKAAVEITHRPKIAERAVPGKKTPAKPKPSVHRYGHIGSAHAHSPAQHLPSRAPAHGMGWSKVNQVALSAPKAASLHRAEAKEKVRGFGSFSSPQAGSPRLILEILEGLPGSLSRGQQVIVTLKGTNLASKPASVTLEASVTGNSGKKFDLAIEPKRRTLEAVGEGKITISFSVPSDAAQGALKLTARLLENAYHIDPSMGKSKKLELVSEIK